MNRVEISIDNAGHGIVKVNGLDISSVVQGIELRCRVGQSTGVVLHLVPKAVTVAAAVKGKLLEVMEP